MGETLELLKLLCVEAARTHRGGLLQGQQIEAEDQ